MMLEIHNWAELDDASRESLLRRPALNDDISLRDGVAKILSAVRTRGDTALRKLTRKLDGADLDDFRVSSDEISSAKRALDGAAIAAIEQAIANVRCFHEAQRGADIVVDTMPGVRCERTSHPIDAVGLYVPAGTAPLPSAAIMLAVPATIAGCPARILCTPPRPDGTANPAVVTAAVTAGVSDIFKIGGAQAIAAMAYGTETIPRVRKVFGPGNAWVTCAKTLVSADPQGAVVDMPAGPSEVLVIADETASVEFVAADLLSQAEHGSDSQVMLVTTSAGVAESVRVEVDRQLATLSRAEIARQSLANSRIVVVDDTNTAIDVSNRYAPEHLILQCDGARDALPDIRNAGSVFIGPWTPEAVGDYCSGTNHVLPTYGYASTYSGLSVDQFERRMTVQELTREGLQRLGGTVTTLAALEGLDAHAAAVTRRIGGAS